MDCWHCWLIRYLRSDEIFQIRFHVKVRRIRRMRLALQDYQQSTTRSQQQAPASAVSTMSGFLTPPVCHLSRKQRCFPLFNHPFWRAAHFSAHFKKYILSHCPIAATTVSWTGAWPSHGIDGGQAIVLLRKEWADLFSSIQRKQASRSGRRCALGKIWKMTKGSSGDGSASRNCICASWGAGHLLRTASSWVGAF